MSEDKTLDRLKKKAIILEGMYSAAHTDDADAFEDWEEKLESWYQDRQTEAVRAELNNFAKEIHPILNALSENARLRDTEYHDAQKKGIAIAQLEVDRLIQAHLQRESDADQT